MGAVETQSTEPPASPHAAVASYIPADVGATERAEKEGFANE